MDTNHLNGGSMLVLGASYPDSTLDSSNESRFDLLPRNLRVLLLAGNPQWVKFTEEALDLGAMRAKAVPQDAVSLITVLQEWQHTVNGGFGLPPLTDIEEAALLNLLNLLRQEGLKGIKAQLQSLNDQLAVLVEWALSPSTLQRAIARSGNSWLPVCPGLLEPSP